MVVVGIGGLEVDCMFSVEPLDRIQRAKQFGDPRGQTDLLLCHVVLM